jgi:hypothetical protein
LKSIIRTLFAIADTCAFFQILITVVALVRTLGQLLTVTFSATSLPTSTDPVLVTWAWFFAALVLGLLGVLGCYLHLKRQVIGVFLIALVLVLGLLPPYGSLQIFLIAALAQATIYALPWALLYLDLRRQGIAGTSTPE